MTFGNDSWLPRPMSLSKSTIEMTFLKSLAKMLPYISHNLIYKSENSHLINKISQKSWILNIMITYHNSDWITRKVQATIYKIYSPPYMDTHLKYSKEMPTYLVEQGKKAPQMSLFWSLWRTWLFRSFLLALIEESSTLWLLSLSIL